MIQIVQIVDGLYMNAERGFSACHFWVTFKVKSSGYKKDIKASNPVPHTRQNTVTLIYKGQFCGCSAFTLTVEELLSVGCTILKHFQQWRKEVDDVLVSVLSSPAFLCNIALEVSDYIRGHPLQAYHTPSVGLCYAM